MGKRRSRRRLRGRRLGIGRGDIGAEDCAGGGGADAVFCCVIPRGAGEVEDEETGGREADN